MSIRRKVLDNSGEIEAFNGVLLKLADKIVGIGWAEADDVADAVAAGDYKTMAGLMEILNEAFTEAEEPCRLVIEGDTLSLVRLDA